MPEQILSKLATIGYSELGKIYMELLKKSSIDDPDEVQQVGQESSWIYPFIDRKSTRLNSSHSGESRMPSSA